MSCMPAYQLHIFKMDKRKYICESCADAIPAEILNHVTEVNTNSNLHEVITSLRENLTTKTNESKSFFEKAK